MDQQIISRHFSTISELLKQADSVGIVVTEHQSIDKVGAGLALYLSLQEAGKNVQIVSKKDPLVEISNLVGIDKLKKSFDGIAKKLVVSLPYVEGEIEKVSYNIEGTKLNINLFAAQDKGITFSDKDVEFIRSGSAPQLIFTIGIRKQDEMAGMVSADSSAKIVRLDTVIPHQDFGEVSLADHAFSSISEIVSMMVREARLPIDQDIAQNLMDGIVAATNNFSSSQTSPMAFASAAFLLSHSARRKGAQDGNVGGGVKSQEVRRVSEVRPQQAQAEPVIESAQPEPAVQQEPENVEEVDGESGQEVPSDWFVPKVFKSSKTQE